MEAEPDTAVTSKMKWNREASAVVGNVRCGRLLSNGKSSGVVRSTVVVVVRAAEAKSMTEVLPTMRILWNGVVEMMVGVWGKRYGKSRGIM